MYKPHTQCSLLNIAQLHQALDDHNAELNKWNQWIAHVLNTVDTHSVLVMALSQCNAPWLQHILHMLLKNGTNAVVNGYNPHSYNQVEFNLTLPIYHVGGASLFTALNKHLCLPAVFTVCNSTLSIKITPTIASITSETTAKNICSVIIKPCAQSGQTSLHGVSLLTDKTALEEVATYHPAQNGVRGLYWKHAAEQLTQKISSGNVHLGKEMLVIVAHCFGKDQTYLVLATPSCKEDYTDWDNDAHKKVGPLWSFATDGDATCQAHPVSSPIYGILSGLAGLNLYTGPHDMTLDFDYKHILKHKLFLELSPLRLT
ncbi:hypothetical protein PAXRUDRAFT_35130 [Paxillus rubicundulus Ve08.2h10]|uniref:Uncharacterized protein n=1 Tax=Paxillus rubicundulus Ve08.2h10 TaxID=930991 RepID=A0A0D0DIW5_9AGAM|nr:hypothetical protein PAXRUDRAFT_35130 [Paxillus rubicundulus Ve08.2h10]